MNAVLCQLWWLLQNSGLSNSQNWQSSSEVYSACISHILEESITLTRSRSCSAATDSIHTNVSVNLALFLHNLHGSLSVKKAFQISYIVSWMDLHVLWLAPSFHSKHGVPSILLGMLPNKFEIGMAPLNLAGVLMDPMEQWRLEVEGVLVMEFSGGSPL